MAKFVTTTNNYRIYELDFQECKENYKSFPTFATWKNDEDIGNIFLTENESSTLEEMKDWCSKN